jgi:3-deoxy-D-manno-octulosonic-acid transferase
LSEVFYNIFLFLFRAGTSIVSLWNKKAGLWRIGRKDVFERLISEIRNLSAGRQGPKSEIIWIHCSSLGEFEQGRPVIESLKSKYPNSKFLITFFSPSGYEIRKDYKGTDWVFYLPIDSKINARKFFDIANPSLVVFVKYDYWYYYLTECNKRKIPLLMISAIFRKNQPFFRWYGNLHRKMLKCFTHFFVQDDGSKTLLQTLNINNVTVAGDTRFDRVVTVAENFLPIPELEKFCSNSKILVAGSTWPNDEKIIQEVISSFPDLKIIIAPHEIHREHLNYVKNIFPDSDLFSKLKTINQNPTTNCLIIDNIGMLSKLYRYASISYIGGGFDKGIHNILEAAVFGKPVIFGPRFEKFKEATDLIKAEAGFSVENKNEFIARVGALLNETDIYNKSCAAAKEYVYKNKGATEKIVQHVQENRLLTN